MWKNWLSLGEWFGLPATPAAPAAPAALAGPDDLIIVDALDIQRRLSDLARHGCPVRLHGPACGDELYGLLSLSAEQTLTLRLDAANASALRLGALNVSTCSREGLLTFSVQVKEHARVLRCDWPSELLRMQSRRHFRLPARGDPSHPARLSLAGTSLTTRLLDLSESGLGFQISLSPAQVELVYERARLDLGALALPVPLLHIVHVRPAPDGPGSVLGAELLGLQAADQREYRRWLLHAQCALARHAQAGATSTRSNR
jgi:hypothetical protein